MVIIRIIARGLKDGREQEAIVDLFDYYDETTGFTSMERTTGWHAAIMAGFMARRQTPSGEFRLSWLFLVRSLLKSFVNVVRFACFI